MSKVSPPTKHKKIQDELDECSPVPESPCSPLRYAQLAFFIAIPIIAILSAFVDFRFLNKYYTNPSDETLFTTPVIAPMTHISSKRLSVNITNPLENSADAKGILQFTVDGSFLSATSPRNSEYNLSIAIWLDQLPLALTNGSNEFLQQKPQGQVELSCDLRYYNLTQGAHEVAIAIALSKCRQHFLLLIDVIIREFIFIV